jgi:hypothetical protein
MRESNFMEKSAQVPPFEQVVAAELKEKGAFQRDLTGQDVAGIMRDVVESLVSGQETVKAGIQNISVSIERQQGVVSGAVRVEKPISATIRVNCVLANDRTPERLRLVQLDVKEEAGFFAKAALKAVNIKGKAQEALSDPNRALIQALASQLEPQGVRLTGADFQFKDTALSISLRGEPIERK